MKQFYSTSRTFVPYLNGNRDLPEEEQIVVTYRIPDPELKSRLKPKPKLKFNYDSEGRTTGGETEVSVDKSSVVAGMLVSIKNLEYENEKGDHKITKWSELYHGPIEYEPLISELYEEFSKELERTIDEKN